VPTANSRYRWETAQSGEDQYVRFDAPTSAATMREDYRNEPNGQGWIVEIDPFDPTSTPKKRTAMGRFAHEGCVFAPPQQGQPLAFYMGDDAQNEYVYKFVTKARYTPRLKGDVLDEGTLYVARFNEDGSGDWLALDINDPKFRAAAAAGVEFKDQADVLVNTRLAADVVGATKMDRPEWGAVHPQTREVYMTMTNNSSRTVDGNIHRPPTRAVRIRLATSSAGASRATARSRPSSIGTSSCWPASETTARSCRNKVARAGRRQHLRQPGRPVDRSQFGILWIQTDMSGSSRRQGPFGENAMLAANPITGEIKRFLAGPKTGNHRRRVNTGRQEPVRQLSASGRPLAVQASIHQQLAG
jgi:uncharacterized protein